MGKAMGRGRTAALLATTLLASAIGGAAAPRAALAQASAAVYQFDIPARPVRSAMNDIVRVTGIDVVFPETPVASRVGNPVQGALTPAQAVATLLSGTGLSYRFTDGNTVTIEEPERAPDDAGGGLLLRTITVTGETATGPLAGMAATTSGTAMKTDTPLIETPRSVSVIGAAEIEARGGADRIADAVAYSPGIIPSMTAAPGDEAAFSIRGFSPWGSLFLDGLRLPRGMTADGDPGMETFGLERVEVLRGPASVFYGQNQPGGIVNGVSKRPTFETGGTGQLQVGSYDRVQGAFDLTGVIGDGEAVAWRLVALGQDSGTQRDGVPDDRLYVAPSLAWRMGDHTAITFLSHYRRQNIAEDYNEMPREVLEAVSPSFNPGEPDYDRDDREQWALGYEFVHEFAPGLRLVQNARYLRADSEYRQVLAWLGFTGNPDAPLELAREPYSYDQTLETWTADTRLEADFATGGLSHRFAVGIDLSRRDIDRTTYWPGGSADPIDPLDPVYGGRIVHGAAVAGSASVKETALYLQDQVEWGNWFFSLGGRYAAAESLTDWGGSGSAAKSDDDAFLVNAGVVYLFDNGVAPYASFSQSFEPVEGAGFDGKPFEPMTADQYEVGVKFQPEGRDLLATAALFQITQKNRTTSDFDHVGFSAQTGEVRVRGLELEAKAGMGPVDLTAAYTWLDSEITSSNDGDEGNELSFVPSHTAALWIDYGFEAGALRGLGLGAGVRYSSAQWGDDANTIRNPAATYVDLAASYDFGAVRPEWEGLSLAVNANNLGENGYIDCNPWGCYFGVEDTVSATLRYTW